MLLQCSFVFLTLLKYTYQFLLCYAFSSELTPVIIYTVVQYICIYTVIYPRVGQLRINTFFLRVNRFLPYTHQSRNFLCSFSRHLRITSKVTFLCRLNLFVCFKQTFFVASYVKDNWKKQNIVFLECFHRVSFRRTWPSGMG